MLIAFSTLRGYSVTYLLTYYPVMSGWHVGQQQTLSNSACFFLGVYCNGTPRVSHSFLNSAVAVLRQVFLVYPVFSSPMEFSAAILALLLLFILRTCPIHRHVRRFISIVFIPSCLMTSRRSLRRILKIFWSNKISNEELLRKCKQESGNGVKCK